MKAVGYPRVSGYAQNTDGYSLDAQVQAIEEYCKEHSIELVAHYREVESAATITGRPSFKAALRHVYSDPDISLIVCVNLDRFSRNVLDAELIRQSMRRKGKRIISTQQKYLTPLICDDDYELEAAIQHAHVDNEKERKKIRTRFVAGKLRKVQEGGWHGHRPPYEYDVVQGELVLNPERARIIKAIGRLDKWTALTAQGMQRWLAGNNGMANADGTRGRVMPPPSARVRLRKRLVAYKYQTGDFWPLNTINRIRRQMRYQVRTWPTAKDRRERYAS